MRLNSIILFFLLVLVGCHSRDIQPKGTGTEYYPLKGGAFWIYSIAETTITQLGGQTNTTYDLKVQVTDSLVVSGQTTYVLQRFKRSDASQPWTALDTWSSRKDGFQAVLQEGNTPFIKLVFPLSTGKTWDGNALNNLGGKDRCADGTFACDDYVVTDFSKPFLGPGLSYDNSVTIIENNDTDPIVKQDVRKSVYAKSIGLVYYESTQLEYCTVGDCIGKQIVEKGSIVKQTLKDNGGL